MTAWQRTQLASSRAPVPVLVTLALSLVALLGVSLTAVLGDGSDAAAATRLTAARGVVVVAVDGAVRPGLVGSEVRPGETVRTAEGGEAVLDTRGRLAMLPGSSAVTVLDGVRSVLEQGSLGVDARRGPSLEIAVGPLLVHPEGVVRVDRGYATRVGVTEGSAGVQGSTGEELQVPRLRQVLVPARTLPRETPPLALLDDDLDRRLAPDLLAADRTLAALATGLDVGPVGPRLAAAVPISFAQASLSLTGPLTGAAARTSEIALPLAVARVSALPKAEPDRYAEVRRLRAEGGSWGVVAGLALAPAGEVGGTFAALLAGPAAGDGAVLLAGPPAVAAPLAAPGPGAPAPSGAPAAGAPASSSGSSTQGQQAPAPAPAPPAPAPAPGPAPAPAAPAPLQQLLTIVGGLVPPGTPAPAAAPAAPAPAAPTAPAPPPPVRLGPGLPPVLVPIEITVPGLVPAG